jgi:hypothetical protein
MTQHAKGSWADVWWAFKVWLVIAFVLMAAASIVETHWPLSTLTGLK